MHAHTQTHTHTCACTHTHTGTCTHEHTNYTKLYLHSLKQAVNSDCKRMKTAALNGKQGRSIIFTFYESCMVFHIYTSKLWYYFLWHAILGVTDTANNTQLFL